MYTKYISYWKRALFAATAMTLAFTASPVFADEDEDEVEEEVIVTGSRIARSPEDGASPIITIDAADIEATGEISLAEVLRQQSVNSFGSFQPRSGSSAQSQATISLRGAGSGRTLVLLDGKRMAGSPSFGGVAANINSIPFAAVERVEILTDGASALYGSDALAGVVNIIMKKDFEGAELSIYNGSPERAGGDQEAYSFTAGISSDVGNVVLSFEHDDRDIVYMKDRWWSSVNYREGYDETTANQAFSHTLNGSFYSCNMYSAYGSGYGYEAIPGCVGNSAFLANGQLFSYGHNAADGSYDRSQGILLYPYNQIMAEDASSGRDTIFVNYNYDINDNHSINARGIYTRVQSKGRYAPVAGYFVVSCLAWADCPYQAEVTASAVTDPDTGAVSYAGDATRIYYRFRSVGPRLGYNMDVMKDYMLEFTGVIGDTGINYAAFAHHSHMDYNQNGYNYTLASVASALAEAGTFEFANMSDAQATSLRHTILSEDDMKLRHGGFTLSGELPIELPGGVIDWVFGTEYMSTDYSVMVDPQSESGNVMGSAGNSSAGYRDIRAQFAEFRAPITDSIELNFAHRHDDYSDFGSADNSKVSLRWQAMDNLVVRTSYSESFIAPTLDALNMSTAFSADTATDYFECANRGLTSSAGGCSAQREVYRLANPNLGPEEGEYQNIGIVYNPIPELSIVMDFYNLELENMEQLVSAGDLLLAEWAGVLPGITSKVPTAGIQRFPYAAGTSVLDDGNGNCAYATGTQACVGALDRINAPMANFGGIEISGIDLAIDYTIETERFGTFVPKLDLTMVDEYMTEDYLGGPMVDKIGRNGVPEFRGLLTVNWYRGNFSGYYQIEHIDSMYENASFDVPTLSSSASGSLDSHTIHNVQFTIDLPTNTDITLGIRNLEDKDPVIDSNSEWNGYLYDLYGRTFFARITQRF